MERDAMGNPVVYVIFDRSRAGTSTGYWRVAVFCKSANAQRFIEERNDDNLFISCQTGTARDFSLARDLEE